MFSSYKFTLILVIALVAVVVGIVREYPKRGEVAQRLSDIESQVTDLEQENEELEQRAAYYRSDAYLEKEARLKLNLRKPGEVLVLIKTKEGEKQEQNAIKRAGGSIASFVKGFFASVGKLIGF